VDFRYKAGWKAPHAEIRALARPEDWSRPPERAHTTCQLRAGVEHMFPDEADPRTLILENVGLAVVELDGDYHAANRFYLEDLAIGLMRPR